MRVSFSPEAFLTDYAHIAVRCKANQLSRSPGFRRHEQADLEQELWAALFAQTAKFNPRRAAMDTFIECVLSTKVIMLVRERRSEKRQQGQHACSLDQATGSIGNAFSSAMTEDGDHRRCLESYQARLFRSEDQQALLRVLNQMPSELQAICRCLMVATVTEAARNLGISRRQLRRAVEVARTYLRDAGFAE